MTPIIPHDCHKTETIARIDTAATNLERRVLDAEHTIYGNGAEGLKMTVARLENWRLSEMELQKEDRAYQRQIRAGLMVGLALIVVNILVAYFKR